MKKTLFLLSVFALISAGVAFGQSSADNTALNSQAVQQEENITIADLGINNPGILPTNPFYFFKQLSRSIQMAATFNSVAKARLQLNVTNETAAEAKKIQEIVSNDDKAIIIGIQNYQSAQEKLKTILKSLNFASSTPAIEQLINSVASSTVLHQKLLDEIVSNASGSVNIKNSVDLAKTAVNESAAVVAENSPVDFVQKLQNVLMASKGSVLKDVRSIEIIANIEAVATGGVQKNLLQLQQNFITKLNESAKKVADISGLSSVKQIIEEIPVTDNVQRAAILNQLEKKLSVFAIISIKPKNIIATTSLVIQSEAISTSTIPQVNLGSGQSEVASSTITEDCGAENEKVNRDPLVGPVDKPCCYGLKEDRDNMSYSICVKNTGTDSNKLISSTSTDNGLAATSTIANPAATYCIQQGFEDRIITAADGSQYGICIFRDGSNCDDWAYLRGDCTIGNASSTSPLLNTSNIGDSVSQTITNNTAAKLATSSVSGQ